jgi:putative addiction module component (TIGR02574 family)
MATHYDEIIADAMRLPLRDRVRLAQQLTSSLDDEVEADVEALWFAEAERRLEELRTRKVEGIDSDEAFQNAHKALDR